MFANYQQVLDPVAGSLAWTALFASLPLVTMFVVLGVLKKSAHVAGILSLIVSLLVAVLVYPMRIGTALNVAVFGAAFSVLAILWIPMNAIWIHNLMVESGHFAVLRRGFGAVSGDARIQTLLIAYCFGALLEALAGGGVPIAIVVSMLVGLGVKPIKAVVVALIADTAPVAFGGLAVPVVTLAQVTSLDFAHLGALIGRQTPVIGLLVPLILVVLIDGRRGLVQAWPAALTTGVAFCVAQFVCSNFISVQLADIVAAFVSAGALLVFLRIWHPAETIAPSGTPLAGVAASRRAGRSGSADAMLTASGGSGSDDEPVSRRAMLVAFSPYLIIVAVFVIAQITAVSAALARSTVVFAWPGLTVTNPAGAPVASVLKLNFLGTTGTLLLVAGIISAVVLGVKPAQARALYAQTVYQLRFMIVTVLAVLAVAWVMNYSGQTATLGLWMAGAGGVFALISPAIGWLGVALTGSDNSSNALFGGLQVASAHATGLPQYLLAAANSSGGVLGKAISPQSLAIGSAAAGMAGQEGTIFRKTLPWSIGLLVLMCVLVYLQSTPVLSWMIF